MYIYIYTNNIYMYMYIISTCLHACIHSCIHAELVEINAKPRTKVNCSDPGVQQVTFQRIGGLKTVG